MRQRIFIGSSSEKVHIARAIAADLSTDHEPTVWDGNIFDLSRPILSSLIDKLDHSDAAVFVLAPDDMARLRDVECKMPRDHVIFELGLFIGRLGTDRTYFIVPKGEKFLHLPSDLLGIVYGSYDASRSDDNLVAAVAPACDQIKAALKKCIQAAKDRRIEEMRIQSESAWIHQRANRAMKMLLTSGRSPSLAANGIKASKDGFSARMGRCDVRVRFGQIQSCEASNPGCVVVLPANDLFDEECIKDPRSSLGAYVQHVFPGKASAIQGIITQKLADEKHELVDSTTTTRSRSYGVGKCVHLFNPLDSQKRIFLVSVTTKRAAVGVRSEAAFLLAAMRAICREMNDHKLEEVHMPIMGSGHGGLDPELALLYLLLSIQKVLEEPHGGTHLRFANIVVYEKAPPEVAELARDLVGRVFAIAKATI